MDFQRIRESIDVERTLQSHVTVVGGAYGLARDLVRCGVGSISMVDFDRVDGSNPARQDFYSSDIGQLKVRAVTEDLKRINDEVEVEVVTRDLCELDVEEFDELFDHTDLFVFATDSFPAQARGNREAQRLGKPALWPALYAGGQAGEIVYHVPGVTPACYRCICASRYDAFATGTAAVNIPSAGATILDLHLVDAVAGQIAVGILTRGASNRFGRLIEQLGNRNLIQIKLDPRFTLNGRDIFAAHLGAGPANFSFTSIALPMDGDPRCPDCGGGRGDAGGVR